MPPSSAPPPTRPPLAPASGLAPVSPPVSVDRRTLLAGLASFGGLAGVGCATKGGASGENSGSEAKDSGGDTAGPTPSLVGWDLVRARIDTVVVLMMENRSFDHYMGARSLLDGDDAVDGLVEGMSNPDDAGAPVPVFPTALDCVPDPPHSWTSCHAQWNEGQNDGFVTQMADRSPESAHEVMGYWTRDYLSTSHTLADHFVLADAWHCALLAGTWPNRFYLHCAQSGAVRTNELPPEPTPSIYPHIKAAGHTWACFYNNLPFLPLVGDVSVGADDFDDMDGFFARAAAGTLPNVSIVEPIFGRNDDHPPAHPLAGQLFIGQLYEALRDSPQWERTLFIVTYDEHGGFFDHVPPPSFPDQRAADGFGQAGFRVPTLLVSPWVKPGTVFHTPVDHTSVIALLTQLYGLEPLTVRDTAADPLFDIFDLDAMAADAPHPAPALPAIEVAADELADPTCTYLGSAWAGTGQPELEAFVAERLGGTPFDRRHLTDQLYADFLQQVEKQGLLVRRATARPR